MISYIKGTVSFIGDSFIVLDCHDMGFHISMPSTSIYRLSEGMEISVYTHLAVKEDDLSLYGFLNSDDLNMFRLLITVSGVGPKGALAILSNISTDELKMAIYSGDSKLISSSKGIGSKTAQKIVVDLTGKFKMQLPMDNSNTGSNHTTVSNDVETAIAFAVSTGVSRSQAMKALSNANIPEHADIDTLLDLIYKNMNV